MKHKKIKLIVLCVMLFVAGYIAWNVIFFGQISPAKASKLCDQFAQEVKANIMAVPGYTVANMDTSCSPQSDEAGSTDYTPSVTARLSVDNIDTSDKMKSSLNNLADKLPTKQYGVFIDNIPAIEGKSAAICVSASKYIDNDGKDYPQGDGGNHPRYTEPGSIADFSPCEGV
ncbi:hypothetical protein HY857_01790 [Candidatus Saccharibacteria bacterium]|nr:hypothetical protein [Candidatus Saccharibacteria bacterium]